MFYTSTTGGRFYRSHMTFQAVTTGSRFCRSFVMFQTIIAVDNFSALLLCTIDIGNYIKFVKAEYKIFSKFLAFFLVIFLETFDLNWPSWDMFADLLDCKIQRRAWVSRYRSCNIRLWKQCSDGVQRTS